MHWKSVLLGAAIASVAFVAAGRVFSGDDQPPAGGPTPEQLKLLQPGPEHQGLKSFEGSWDGKGTYQGTPWTSHMTGTMVMGGRFLQKEEEISIPSASMTMRMRMFLGYDNLQKKYVQMGMGDDSTGFMTAEGQHDAAKKVYEMRGVEHGPGKDVKYRSTVSDAVDGTFHLEFFMEEGAGEQKVLVGDYQKK